VEKASELRSAWDIETLRFKVELVRAFRETRIGSVGFKVRLIEIVAVAIHQLGVSAFKADYTLHQGDDLDSITNHVNPRWPTDPPPRWLYYHPPAATLFYHCWYRAGDIYPEGVADVVGYWVESRILGGVFIFDRKREAARDPDKPPNVYLHADRSGVTGRICQLRDDQQDALVAFFLSESPPPSSSSQPQSSPLPILPDSNNNVRVNPHSATFAGRIYRDVWERRPYTIDQMVTAERRPRSTLDYPEAGVLMEYINTLPLPVNRLDCSQLMGVPDGLAMVLARQGEGHAPGAAFPRDKTGRGAGRGETAGAPSPRLDGTVFVSGEERVLGQVFRGDGRAFGL
jgi:hypothetical protein